MQINHCLIAAAGFGTRMGVIGQKLPKVLWPVFEKSLLELQVAYAKSLGIPNIYINLHHMGEEIHQFCKTKTIFDDVKFLWERPEILDIGGGIHNLATQPEVKYRGKLLVLNADQFFYIKKEEFLKFLIPYEKAPVILFNYWVNSSLGYNAVEVDSNRIVKKIVKNKDISSGSKIETYTGISLIDLERLKPVPGASSYFESVCPYEKIQAPAILLENVDYWDFGTVRRFWETSHKILEVYRVNSNHPFLRFLVNEKALKTWKINLQTLSYHAKSAGVINLCSDQETKDLDPCIIMISSKTSKKKNTIWFGELSDEVNID